MHDQGNDMKIDLADVHESIRNMNSQDMSLINLKASNNHEVKELKQMDYPYMTEKIKEKLAQPCYQFLLWFDFDILYNRMAQQMHNLTNEKKVSDQIQEQFEENWNARQTGVNQKRPPLVLDSDSEEQTDEELKQIANEVAQTLALDKQSVTSDSVI